MSMHLLPAYWTTNNTKKRKKRNKTQRELAAEIEHEKFLKKVGYQRSRSSVGVEQRSSKPWVASSSLAESAKPQIVYQSSMAKKEEKKYTGDEIIGVAQMHKSNAVPIRGKKEAEEISKMRRG